MSFQTIQLLTFLADSDQLKDVTKLINSLDLNDPEIENDVDLKDCLKEIIQEKNLKISFKIAKFLSLPYQSKILLIIKNDQNKLINKYYQEYLEDNQFSYLFVEDYYKKDILGYLLEYDFYLFTNTKTYINALNLSKMLETHLNYVKNNNCSDTPFFITGHQMTEFNFILSRELLSVL